MTPADESPAAGTNSASAPLIIATLTRINGGTGGRRIPATVPAAGLRLRYRVFNITSAPINLYPPTGTSWPSTPWFSGGTDLPYPIPPFDVISIEMFPSGFCIFG